MPERYAWAMDMTAITRRLDAYERLVRLDKPVGALLLLWPTLWAVWIAAEGRVQPDMVIIFVVGTFLMRSAGCAINDWADRDFDGRVARTRERPLTIKLSFVALAIAALYPFTKRFFAFPQLVLGVAFGFGIPMAFAATTGALPWACWALLAANICYSFAYDTEYAMVDRDDDLKIGIRTSAIALGRFDVAAVMASYALMTGLLTWVGASLRLHWPYFAGLAAATGMMAYHYVLIRGRTREGCFRAFRHNNWVGGTIFAGLALSYLLQHWKP
jgi:4-hydroxybenzoate polyprenyltransferase